MNIQDWAALAAEERRPERDAHDTVQIILSGETWEFREQTLREIMRLKQAILDKGGVL